MTELLRVPARMCSGAGIPPHAEVALKIAYGRVFGIWAWDEKRVWFGRAEYVPGSGFVVSHLEGPIAAGQYKMLTLETYG